MNLNNLEQAFTVWIDESKKIISIKEAPDGRAVYFENRDKGMEMVSALVSKGYKIG